MVHLPSQVAHGDAAFRLAQPGGPRPEPLHHGAEQPRQRADLVVAIALERDVEALHVDLGRAARQLPEGTADPVGEPAGEEQGDRAREQHRRGEGGVHAPAQRDEGGEGVCDHDPCFTQAGSVTQLDEGNRQRAHHLCRRVDARQRVGREGQGDSQVGVGSEPRQEARVHGDAAHQGVPTATEAQRVDPC